MANNRIDKINVGGADYDIGSTNFVFDTYAEYRAAYSAGDIPVGSVVYIKEGSTDNTITALQVVYNNGTVKSALDKLNNDLDSKYVIETKTYTLNSLTVGLHGFNLDTIAKSGYKPVLISPVSLARGSTVLYVFQLTDDGLIYCTYNSSYNESGDITIKLRVVWERNS